MFVAIAGNLEESTSRLPGDSSSRDRWLEEVDYRQAVTKHLSLWRERTTDLRDVTTRILEMEGECHQRLKDILFSFLPKRHDLFSDVRGMLDPALVALETSQMLSEMGDIDKRLEQAVAHFQPGKKRSILSMTLGSSTSASNDKSSTVPSLDDFTSLAAVDAQALKKSENVHEYGFVQIRAGKEWQHILAVVTQQNFLHTYVIPANFSGVSSESSIDDQELAVSGSLKAGPPGKSLSLATGTFEQAERDVEIRFPKDNPTSEEADERTTETAIIVLRFLSVEAATQWVAERRKLSAPAELQAEPKKPDSDAEKMSVLRV